MKKITLLFSFMLCVLNIFAQFIPASFQHVGNKIPYQIMYPEGYDATKRYPLVVFLHGAGERGDDNEKQFIHGKQFLIDNFRTNYPAIVIAPQCPVDDYWANVQRNQIGNKSQFTFGISDKPTRTMETLVDLINWWISSGLVKTDQIYVGGLSMGGMGTFELLWRMPGTFAAAFPICGGTSIDKMPLYANNTAVWIYHGEVDDVVSPDFSRKAHQKLKELGCDVKYTEYKGVNHGSWVNVFAEKDLVPWLFSHQKK
jgi:predicted peptidase